MAGPAKSTKPNGGPKSKAKSAEQKETELLETWKRLNQNMHSTMNRAVRKVKDGDDYKNASPNQKTQLEKDARKAIEEK